MCRGERKPEIFQFRTLQICSVKLHPLVEKHSATLRSAWSILGSIDFLPAPVATRLLEPTAIVELEHVNAPADIPKYSVIKPLNSWTVKLAQFRHFQRWISRQNDVCSAVGKTQLWTANAVQKLCSDDTRCLLTNSLDAKFSTRSLGSNTTDTADGAFK